jgi:hypothetical protein
MTMSRWVIGMLVGVGVTVSVALPAAAQELPTGAGRVVEKVQTRIFFAKTSLLTEIGDIQAKAEGIAGGAAGK